MVKESAKYFVIKVYLANIGNTPAEFTCGARWGPVSLAPHWLVAMEKGTPSDAYVF
jgi:hypothetical protein